MMAAAVGCRFRRWLEGMAHAAVVAVDRHHGWRELVRAVAAEGEEAGRALEAAVEMKAATGTAVVVKATVVAVLRAWEVVG